MASASHFYVVNKKGIDFSVIVECEKLVHAAPIKKDDEVTASFNRMMIRVSDAEEYLMTREFITDPGQTGAEKLKTTAKIPVIKQKGIIRIDVITGIGAVFNVRTEPPLPFGILSSFKVIAPLSEDRTAYVYVPNGAKLLELENIQCEAVIRDQNGRTLYSGGKQTITVDETDAVWEIDIKNTSWPGSKIFAHGFPVILCPDKQTALDIKGSYEKLSDGTIVPHKFQARLDRLVRAQFNKKEQFSVPEIKSWKDIADTLASNPEKYGNLITGYLPYLPHYNIFFDRQDVNPSSVYFGAIHCPYMYVGHKTSGSLLYTVEGSPLNPKTAEQMVPELVPPSTDSAGIDAFGTTFSPWGMPGLLGRIYHMEKEINPYYQNKNLLNRVIIAGARDIMLLNEEQIVTYDEDKDRDWPGCIHFIQEFGQTKAFGHIGPEVKKYYPEIYREWYEGIMMYTDRLSFSSIYPPANQGAHNIMATYRAFKGSADIFYSNLTVYQLDKYISAMQKIAGYFIESYGPCASYNGLTLSLLAVLYAETKMPKLGEAIRKNYFCFNHSIAAEPSGTLIGVTDFNHRVHKPWTMSQTYAGRRIARPYFDEAGVFFKKSESAEEIKSSAQSILAEAEKTPWPISYYTADLKRVPLSVGMQETYFDYYNPAGRTNSLFPYEEKQFIRNIGDEFIAVREQGYYVLIYTGKPGIWRYTTAKPDEKFARTGGGISLFWTPEYKVVLTGQGWNSMSHHGIIAAADGTLYYADYMSVNYELDSKKKTLYVSGMVQNTPLTYTHRYTFLPDSISVVTAVKATTDYSCGECFLQFPVFTAKENGSIQEISGDNKKFIFKDNKNNSSWISFSETQQLSFGVTSKDMVTAMEPPSRIEYTVRQAKVNLSARWESGDEEIVNYSLR